MASHTLGGEALQMQQSQQTLPLGPTPVNDWRAKYDDGTYPVGFWEWLADNMHVFQEFVRLALRTQARGQRRWSADGLCHVLRWRTAVREHSDSGFKINNCATAGLARLAMEVNPRLRGFFEIRQPPGSCGRQRPSCNARRGGSRA
jgi:hypothetical protein